MNPDNRAIWDRYVRLRRGALVSAGNAGIGGEDAALIAAYLDLRLDEWERAALERRLVDEPILLDALIAARRAMDAPVTPLAVPQAVTAFALNLAPGRSPVRAALAPARPAPRPRRRWLLPVPGFAWALGTAAFLGAFAIGAVVTWTMTEPPVTAQEAPGKERLAEELRERNNSIFEDPARTIFDGMDVDD
jgi:hypothetical protein